MNTRKCPECGREIVYKSKYRRNWAESNRLICNYCSSAHAAKARSDKKRARGEFLTRSCPKCNKLIVYTMHDNRNRAEKKGSVCNQCAVRSSPEISKKISETLKGRKYPDRVSNIKGEENYFRKCPNCKKSLGYKSKYARDRAEKSGSVCNPCSNILYKKSWSYVIKNEHIQKMAAKKAGYETYSAYMDDLEAKKKYFREVRALTRKQDITILPNYERLLENRGLNGISGAYQLDHIISVSEGYRQNISPKQIADISNLQIIPWKENLLKSNT